jgi:hypothetical protein
MGDVLSQGGDREPSPWPRRAVIAVLMVALAVLVIRHLPHGQEAAAHRPGIASPASPAPLVAPGPVLPVAPGVAQSLPNEPGGIVGPVAPWDGDLRLPVTGQRPTWFWPSTGQVKRIGGLPASRSGYVFTRADGGWAVQPAAATGQSCGSCAALPLPVYFLADSAQSVTHVGTADAVAPAAGSGLWLTSYPLNTDLATAVGTAQQVSAAGAPLGPPVRLPEGYVIDRGTDRGLLLTPVTPRDGVRTYRLWDPTAARFGRSFDGVIAASTGQIAWAAQCAPQCLVHVLDLVSGRATVSGLPRRSSVAAGAFSPDGDYLALQVSFGSGGDSGALEMQLEVASVTSGALTVVPGTWASSDALAGFGWPAGGDSLVAELSFTSKVQVASWRPGTALLAVAVVRPGQDPDSLIVG